MLLLIKKSLSDFKKSFPEYFSFELIYTFLASLVMIPFLTYLFNRIFMLIGKGEALLNSDVYKLGLSFNGLIGLFVISFLAVAVLFVEFGTLIIISQKRFFEHKITVAQSFMTAIKKLPHLIGLGIVQLFFLLLLVIPFLDASTIPPLIDINTSIFVTELLRKSLFKQVIYFAAFLGVIYLYIRWVFTLHVMFIENKSITKALATSWRLTRQHKFRLIFSIILMNVLIAVVTFLVVTLISQVGSLIESKTFGDFIGNYLQLFSSYITIILSLFFFPLNIIMLTRLYYETRKPYRDEIILAKSSFLKNIEIAMKQKFQRRRGVVITGAVLGIAGTVLINTFIQSTVIYLPWDVAVASHKGDGFDSPENSMSAVESAIAKGVEIVEIDVTLTKDEVLVLSHDQDIMRLTGKSDKIKDLTYEELKQIDIGSSFDESFAGETFPTLDQILSLTMKTNTGIIIDVKTDTDEHIYAETIAKLVEKHEAENLALVQSFNYRFLKIMREQKKDIQLGQIMYVYAGKLSSLDVDFYTVRETMLTKRFVTHAKKKNRDIWVWTVNSNRNIEKVLSYDIDGIITDYPERVERIIGIKNTKEDE